MEVLKQENQQEKEILEGDSKEKNATHSTIYSLHTELLMEKLHNKIGKNKNCFEIFFNVESIKKDIHVMDKVRNEIRDLRSNLKDKFSDIHELIRILESKGPQSSEKELLLQLSTKQNKTEKIQKELKIVFFYNVIFFKFSDFFSC